MPKPVHYTIRFFALLAIIACLSLLVTPSTPSSSPYASALAGLGPSSAFAAKTACHTICFLPHGGNHWVCNTVDVTRFITCVLGTGNKTCTTLDHC